MINLPLMVQAVEHSGLSKYWSPTVGSSPSGGSGNWDNTSAYWTVNNTRNIQFANDVNAKVIFQAASGTVGIYPGPVQVNKISFFTNGYVLSGNAVLMAGVLPEINVAPGVTSTLGVSITGPGGFTKTGLGQLLVNWPSDTTGPIYVTGGGLYFQFSTGTMAAISGMYLSNGALLTLNNSGSNSNDRIAGALSLSQSCEVAIQGSASVDTNEIVGGLTLADGNSTLTITQGTTGRSTVLTASNLFRTGKGTLFIRASSLGTQNTTVGKLAFQTSLATQLIGAGGVPAGTASIKNLGIFPFIFSTTSISNTTFNSLSTYDSTFASVRGLATAEYDANTLTASTAGNNVKFSATSDTLTASKTINSLFMSASAVQNIGVANNASLTISSGVLALGSSTGTQAGTGYSSNITPSIYFPTEGVIAVAQTASNLTLTNVGGNNGLTKTGAGTVTCSSIAAGDVVVNQGNLVSNGATFGNVTVNNGAKYTANSGASVQPTAQLTLNYGSSFAMNFSGQTTIKAVVINGLLSNSGIYTAAQLQALDTTGTIFVSGAGTLNVTNSSGGIVTI